MLVSMTLRQGRHYKLLEAIPLLKPPPPGPDRPEYKGKHMLVTAPDLWLDAKEGCIQGLSLGSQARPK
jgi:hypothetical protein